MSKHSIHPLPLALSIVAILFSGYATFTAGGFDFLGTDSDEFKSTATIDGEEKDRTYAIIDQYIADQQAEYEEQIQVDQQAQIDQQLNQDPIEVSVDDDPMKGDENAPVTIVEFSDYECPFCQRFYNDTYPLIKTKYIDTGQVNYVFRDFPLPFHANAIPAANAAECVREQTDDEAYFQYHDLLFGTTDLSVENLKVLAADFDLDQSAFATCVDENKYLDEIEADLQAGQNYGVEGTPGFFINGIFLGGAQPYATFEAAIEKALAE